MSADRESIAASASDRVRAIVEAAERSAAEIRREAEDDVFELRGRVSAARERLAAVTAELDAVAASLEGGAPGAPSAAPAADPAPAPTPAADAASAASGDAEGARLVALNMALSGKPRAETARYLDEHFAALADADALLDDVYASAAR